MTTSTTDNECNFVKAFQVFHKTASDSEAEEEEDLSESVSFQDVNNVLSSRDGGDLSHSPQMHITDAEPHVQHRQRQMVALSDLTSTGTPSALWTKQADQKLWQKSARGSCWLP